MTSRSSLALVLAAVIALPLACGKESKTEPVASASASASEPPEPEAPPPAASSSASAAPAPSGSAAAAEKRSPVQRRGTAGALFSRVRALELSDEQTSKLDAIDERLWGAAQDEDDTKVALKEFFAALLDGVKTGHIVEAKLAPHYATLERVAKARHEAEAAALSELHGLLEDDQRKELVEALRKKYPSAAEKAAKAASAAKSAKPAKPATPADKARVADRAKRRLTRVATLLGLDELQQKRVAPVLARFEVGSRNKALREAQEKRMRALLAVFEKDEFDATKLDLGKGPKARMADRVAYITSLLAILKVDQRDKLARTLQRPGSRHWGAAVVGDVAPVEDE